MTADLAYWPDAPEHPKHPPGECQFCDDIRKAMEMWAKSAETGLPLPWVYDDGGREAAGFKGSTDDCVTRSIAIASGLPYRDVYDALNEEAKRERPRNGGKRSSARTGVKKATGRRYLKALGFEWTPTMQIGSGCQVHLAIGELPMWGRLIVQVSGHITAVVNGVILDTEDPSREGKRCVYGYWLKAA